MAILLTGTVAGALSFAWALHDANELLDGNLQDIADMISGGQMAVPREQAELAASEPENDVLVVPLAEPGAGRPTGLAAAVDGLAPGLHTVAWQEDKWRILISTAGTQRIAIAQRTQQRNEVAQHSAIRTLIPLLLLIPVLALLVRELVSRTLRPVAALARYVDVNPMVAAANLPEADVPVEIAPFIESIRRLLSELTQTLEQQRRFVANAAHELRSPVAALYLQAANLSPVVAGEEGRQRLDHLLRGMERMRHLLDQLLSMARSEGETGGLGPIRVADVARDVIAELVLTAETKGVDLGMDLCDEEVYVQATALAVRTLIRNAVENAVTYSPSDSMVTVSVYRDGNDAVVAVENGGPGMDESQVERAFEPFYRVPGTHEPGTGLGLAIVAALARRLGGHATLGPARTTGVRFEYRQVAVQMDATGPR